MDPLVKLGDDLKPVPNLAESWDISEDGKMITFHLRQDGKWTNGDPVTADDFVYSWLRTISPDLAADYAYQFYGIVGAQEYNGWQVELRGAQGQGRDQGDRQVHAAGVQLTSPQPWFVQQAAHHSFLAVNQEGRRAVWAPSRQAPPNIVTDGPFKLDEVGARLRARSREVGRLA